MARPSQLALVAVLALAIAGATISIALAGTPTRAARRPTIDENRILAIALDAARRSGDAHPTLIQHSEGTRAAANRLTAGAAEGGSALSILIAERGYFVVRDGPRPFGTPAPTGRVQTLIVDAYSGEVTDFGVENRYPRLGMLGPVTTDLAASVRAACPRMAPGSVHSARPGAARAVVPGNARSLLLCRYGGADLPWSKRLLGQRLIASQTTVSDLAGELDALPAALPGVEHCLLDDGAEIIGYFRYRTSPDDPVQIRLSGCQGVTNGRVGRSFDPGSAGPRFLGTVARLLHLPALR